MPNTEMTFDDWLKALDELSVAHGFKVPVVTLTGRDCWRGYYDDGYTPEEAFNEDMSYV